MVELANGESSNYTNLYCHAYLLKYVSHVHGHAHTLHVDWKKKCAESFKRRNKNGKCWNFQPQRHKNYLSIKKCKRNSQTDWWWETKLHPFNLRLGEGKNAHIYMFYLWQRKKIIGSCRVPMCHAISFTWMHVKMHWIKTISLQSNTFSTRSIESSTFQIRKLPLKIPLHWHTCTVHTPPIQYICNINRWK